MKIGETYLGPSSQDISVCLKKLYKYLLRTLTVTSIIIIINVLFCNAAPFVQLGYLLII